MIIVPMDAPGVKKIRPLTVFGNPGNLVFSYSNCLGFSIQVHIQESNETRN